MTGNCTTAPSYKMVECAELLVDTVAMADWAFFMKNGTDATTFSILTARAFTGKKKKCRHGIFSAGKTSLDRLTAVKIGEWKKDLVLYSRMRTIR